jgi:hypothetical protein
MRAPYHRWWFWGALVVIALLVALLSGCQDKVVAIGCPPVPPYPLEIQKQAAVELRALPAESVLRRFMDDYSRMRDQARECGR